MNKVTLKSELKSKLLISAYLLFIPFINACAPASTNTATPVKVMETPVEEGTPTKPVSATPTENIATETLSAIETPVVVKTSSATAGSEVTVTVNKEGTFAPFVADDQGRSLYAFMNDAQNSGASACVDDCAVEWPPLLVLGTPSTDTGVDPSLLSTLPRDDGSVQVTYNGWPLYYYNMDTIPGTTNGQSYNGVWFLLSPVGEPIQQ